MKKKVYYSSLFVFVLFFMLLIVPFGCGGSSSGGGGTESGSGSVSGIVTNQDNEPIEGAICSVNIETSSEKQVLSSDKQEETTSTYTVTSDSDGRFTIDAIPCGSWPMTITMTGYQTKTVTVNITDGAVYTVPAEDTQITPQGTTPSPSPSPTAVAEYGTIEGRVVDTYGHPISNAFVVINTTSTEVFKGVYSSITDSNGYYAILNVPVGTWPMAYNRKRLYANIL